MKARYILLFLVCCQLSFSQSQNKEIKPDETGYYFIRHAEKNRSNPKDSNPELNKEGKLRALNWAYFFREIPLDKSILNVQKPSFSMISLRPKSRKVGSFP